MVAYVCEMGDSTHMLARPVMCVLSRWCPVISCLIAPVLVFRREDKMIVSQICRNGKDCGQIDNRMSDNNEKLPCLH